MILLRLVGDPIEHTPADPTQRLGVKLEPPRLPHAFRALPAHAFEFEADLEAPHARKESPIHRRRRRPHERRYVSIREPDTTVADLILVQPRRARHFPKSEQERTVFRLHSGILITRAAEHVPAVASSTHVAGVADSALSEDPDVVARAARAALAPEREFAPHECARVGAQSNRPHAVGVSLSPPTHEARLQLPLPRLAVVVSVLLAHARGMPSAPPLRVFGTHGEVVRSATALEVKAMPFVLRPKEATAAGAGDLGEFHGDLSFAARSQSIAARSKMFGTSRAGTAIRLDASTA